MDRKKEKGESGSEGERGEREMGVVGRWGGASESRR